MSHETGAVRDAIAPRSAFYQGPFGRICDDLPPWSPPGVGDGELAQHFLNIANQRMIELPSTLPADVPPPPFGADPADDPGNATLPAGYTYFGQFVDHDITFDPASSLVRQNDPNKLLNFRTPRLDLDCVYGRGPDDQPYLYDNTTPAAAKKFLIGAVAGSAHADLPRNADGRALIGDARNDENAIVSQLHLAFLTAHNTLVDRAVALGVPNPFERARTTLRWLYQWIVWQDFLKRITLTSIHANALRLRKPLNGVATWERGLKDVYDWRDRPYIPVEFAGAAYRFGHSMVRNSYQTNISPRGFGAFVPIFDNTVPGDPDDLRGFRPMRPENVIQWDWFVKMQTSLPGNFPQLARKIDTKLANALAFLHEGAPGSPMNVLASRNLLRGVRLELPSGPDVARKFGLTPIALDPDEPQALWYYVLKEAETQTPAANAGNRLGKLGSIIVSAVFAGLLAGDPRSFFSMQPTWTPDADPLLRAAEDRVDDGANWTLASIIRISGRPFHAGQF
ncbi:MAG: peroxidase family protein [Ilumatobacteraceae bacterium]